jgi:type II secretory pathway component GspD/PulD (secretin)
VTLPGLQESAITFGLINNTDLLTVTLNALAEKGQTKILAEPRIVTLNNRQARIQVGSRLPFSTVTIAPGGVTTQAITFVDVGIILTVTPVINQEGRIRLTLKPEASFPGAPSSAGPPIQTRNAETEVLLRDGETLAVGGLIDETIVDNARKVPLLGDIPVLGVFFRSTSKNKRRSELIVFVTPRIVKED